MSVTDAVRDPENLTLTVRPRFAATRPRTPAAGRPPPFSGSTRRR